MDTNANDKQISSQNENQTKSKKIPLRRGLKEIYYEFCSNTTIHGFQYFGQQRPWKEVFFWIFVFAITIYFCMAIIVSIYVRWSETPVIVSFSEKSTPIWSIPFPAVTICSETQRARNSSDPTFEKLIESLEAFVIDGKVIEPNISSIELEEILTLMHVCDFDYRYVPPTINYSLEYFKIIDRMLPQFGKYYVKCRWFHEEVPCNQILMKVYNEDGLCYTFNSLKAVDIYRENTFQYQMSLNNSEQLVQNLKRNLSWSLEQGYAPDVELHTYPERVLSSGSLVGLQIMLQNFDHEEDYTCRGANQGLKIMLHSPDDIPSAKKHFVRIGMGKEVLIAVKPKMITTSSGIAEYPANKRLCFLQNERKLKFFKTYSQNNCELECLTNFTLIECGCVSFTMPRTLEMPVCKEDKIECYGKAQHKLLVQQFNESLINSNLGEKNHRKVESKCNCLPACTSLEYETEISEGDFNAVNVLKAHGFLEFYDMMFPNGSLSLLNVYFKENQFITSKRSELYGVTELLANFGGVVGLFMGFSILSIVEVFYHFTLRLWSHLQR